MPPLDSAPLAPTAYSGLHTSDPAPPANVGQVDASEIAPPNSLSDLRWWGREQAAPLIQTALATARLGQRSLAKLLGLRSAKAAERWCDPDDSRAMSVADVLAAAKSGAAGRTFARQVFTAGLALVNALDRPVARRSSAPESPERHLAHLAAQLGEVSRAVEGGDARARATAISRLAQAVEAAAADAGCR